MNVIKEVIQKTREIVGGISPKLNTNLNFLIKKKRIPNLKKPETFDEKITWLKLNEYPKNSLVSQCSDKYRVRDYITEKGFGSILNELYAVYDSPEEINFALLPKEFVVKWNNDYNSTYVVQDKDSYPLEKMVNELGKKGKEKFYLRASELHYRNIDKKIIIEKLLTEPGTKVLTDYKLYCYNGSVEYIMVCVGRGDEVKFYFFDRNWKFLRINKDGQSAPLDFELKKPDGIDKMISIAEILSLPFRFVRSDFYLIEGKVYFGELTFTPASGMDANLSPELDKKLGEKIDLGDLI